jgi:RimJ/RimL family protein N-acetyltransferase
MNFRVLERKDMQFVLEWRNKYPEALRTPFNLTLEQQNKFYDDVICNRNANARFWAIEVGSKLIGMCGLEGIQWENSLAEISIILDPEYQGQGYGRQAIKLLLEKGFLQMNLENIYGECYVCNPAYNFWEKLIEEFCGTKTKLPSRKYWNGIYYDALYFNFNKSNFNYRGLIKEDK